MVMTSTVFDGWDVLGWGHEVRYVICSTRDSASGPTREEVELVKCVCVLTPTHL